jgi:hypothetical protein
VIFTHKAVTIIPHLIGVLTGVQGFEIQDNEKKPRRRFLRKNKPGASRFFQPQVNRALPS